MAAYTPFQIENMLDSLQIVVDTREQDTAQFRERIRGFGVPCIREKLNVGDYGAVYTDTKGIKRNLHSVAVCERKMSLDELCHCFTKDRKRFQREFDRAKADGCRVHLIVENASYEKLFAHQYRSRLSPKSLIASLLSWSARYNMEPHFCKAETTGRLIADILHYELREYLINQ
ncbi:MAG: hypothetical protein HFE78_07400 [Clostridiales bacterium]|nr:hypothetical protein [Clostridiales bacterium]